MPLDSKNNIKEILKDKYSDRYNVEIKKLNATLGIPTVVKQLKVEDFDVITKRAHAEANPLYPVPVLFSPKELAKILEKVLPNE